MHPCFESSDLLAGHVGYWKQNIAYEVAQLQVLTFLILLNLSF
jgi:hypothetical protein